jgi:hypothetical protein
MFTGPVERMHFYDEVTSWLMTNSGMTDSKHDVVLLPDYKDYNNMNHFVSEYLRLVPDGFNEWDIAMRHWMMRRIDVLRCREWYLAKVDYLGFYEISVIFHDTHVNDAVQLKLEMFCD